MSSSLWRYLQNPFDNVTKNNTKLMNLLAKDHHDKLKGSSENDANIAKLYKDFLPKYEAFTSTYVALLTQQRTYQSFTSKVESLFSELTSVKIRKWDIKIQFQHDEATHIYRSLLPNGRSPFQTGGYETRTREVKSLGELLLQYKDMENLQQEVEAFGLQLENARTEQQGAERKVSHLSNELEIARLALAVNMHSVLGFLIGNYAQNIKEVASFYDLEYLRSSVATNTSSTEVQEDDVFSSFSGLDDMES